MQYDLHQIRHHTFHGDKKLCQLLALRFPVGRYKNITVKQGDALLFAPPTTPYKVVANIPYTITSAVLQKFLLEEPKPLSLTLMVQREVARRVTAIPGAMSSLAVMAQTYGVTKIVEDVSRTAFFPPPKVDSAVIHIDLFSATHMADFFRDLSPAQFFALVHTGFSTPRRQLHNTIRELFGTAEAAKNALDKAKISPQARPQELSVANWRALARQLIRKP